MRSLSLYIKNAIALHSTSIMRSLLTLHQKCDACGERSYRS
ncbi:hypothetical protein VB711_17580 [Cronbergia sp. UHCC 0137]|nr:hypothetical protein [Cronbergia sp. UHCC 0137]MEA5619638.1 hypothetical protein [Cronbergia sp. UHCC 0137]